MKQSLLCMLLLFSASSITIKNEENNMKKNKANLKSSTRSSENLLEIDITKTVFENGRYNNYAQSSLPDELIDHIAEGFPKGEF